MKEIFGNKEVTFKKLRDFRVTKWRKNPFVQGAYSYIAVGASGDGENFELLVEKLKGILRNFEFYNFWLNGNFKTTTR